MELVVKPEARKVGGGGAHFVQAEQGDAAEKWLKDKRYPVRETVEACIETLSAGYQPLTLRCPACDHAHLDTGAHAKQKHDEHVCTKCNREWKMTFKGIGNPLARFAPILKDGKILLTEDHRLFRTHHLYYAGMRDF